MIRPQPRPAIRRDTPPEQPMDLSRAMPGRAMATMPSSAEQLKALDSKLKTQTSQVAAAKSRSDRISAEAAALRAKLIATAARISQLETDRAAQIRRVAELQAEYARLSAGFAQDRVAVTRLIAVLERLQHDMPPPAERKAPESTNTSSSAGSATLSQGRTAGSRRPAAIQRAAGQNSSAAGR